MGYSASASLVDASRLRTLVRLRESLPTVLARRRQQTPSRLGHTKRQRHVRHNISSSGKRATRNVATYATCGDCEFTGESTERGTLHYLYSSHSFPPSFVCSENGRERRYPSKVRPDSRFLSHSHARGRRSVRVRNRRTQRDWSANVTND